MLQRRNKIHVLIILYILLFNQDGIASDNTNHPTTLVATHDVHSLPDDPHSRLIKYGQTLSERTFSFIGPEVKDNNARYAGNNLACTSCHENSGTKKNALSWVGISNAFPQYRARENRVISLEERINGCMERSLVGKALPLEGLEMKAFIAYMKFLSRDTSSGLRLEEHGLPAFKILDRRADITNGGLVYQESCASCHGANGAGVRAASQSTAAGYIFPPLWGADSFGNGTGMSRLLIAAAFIKANMPLGTTYSQPRLTDDQAYDVAAYVLSKPRPINKDLAQDFPARWNKPVDAAFPPYSDDASEEQHRLGPFGPLLRNSAQRGL